MKNLVLVSFLFLGLIGCGEKETVEPTARKMASNVVKIIIESGSKVGLGIVYVNPDGTAAETIGKDTIVTGNYEAEYVLTKDQNFAYAIQKRDYLDRKEIKVRMIFRDYDQTKAFTTSDLFYEIYKFN